VAPVWHKNVAFLPEKTEIVPRDLFVEVEEETKTKTDLELAGSRRSADVETAHAGFVFEDSFQNKTPAPAPEAPATPWNLPNAALEAALAQLDAVVAQREAHAAEQREARRAAREQAKARKLALVPEVEGEVLSPEESRAVAWRFKLFGVLPLLCSLAFPSRAHAGEPIENLHIQNLHTYKKHHVN